MADKYELKLRQDVYDLAAESLNAALLPRQKEFPSKTQAILERLASRGIVGGPTYALLAKQCSEEIVVRVGMAADELRRAAESKGVRYHRDLARDLDSALDKLCQGRWNDVFSNFTYQARTVPTYNTQVQQEYDFIFARTADDALRKGKADLSILPNN